MASAGNKTLSIATVNCAGNNTRPPPIYRDATALRYALLEEVFRESDILMLQEIRCKTEINNNLEQSHHIYYIESENTGILLKKDSFSPDVKFHGKSHYNTHVQNVGLTAGGLVFAKAKPLGWQKTILVVSYHGPTGGNKIDIATKMIKLCLLVKGEEEADLVIIGGDFNLSDEDVEDRVLPEVQDPQSTFKVSSCDIPMVHRLEILDYFVHEDGLDVTNPQIKQFPNRVVINENIIPISYRQHHSLQTLLDHDPVVAKMELNESVGGTGGGGAGGEGGIGGEAGRGVGAEGGQEEKQEGAGGAEARGAEGGGARERQSKGSRRRSGGGRGERAGGGGGAGRGQEEEEEQKKGKQEE